LLDRDFDPNTTAKLKLLCLREEKRMIKKMISDIAASASISFAKALQNDNCTLARRTELQSGLFAAVTFVAKFMPSSCFRQALAIVVAKVDLHDHTVRPILLEAVLNKVRCYFPS